VDLVQTNFYVRYYTNSKVLTLTNWETVLLFKTNWISHPLTNIVEVDVAGTAPSNSPAPSAPLFSANRIEVVPPVPAAIWTDAFAVEAERTRPPGANNQPEVRLSVAWATNTATPLLVRQWRVEREDGSM